jgi:hypothetical protein
MPTGQITPNKKKSLLRTPVSLSTVFKRMSSSSDDVFAPNYLGKVSSRKGEQIDRLKQVHIRLRDLKQSTESKKALQATASHLVSQRFLGNSDKDVRLLTCCCLVDIFRAWAPESPFNNDEIVSIFEVIIAQLKGFALNDPGSGTGALIMYILTSLATIQSCVVPICLAREGVAGADTLANSMIFALISSIRAEHSDEGGSRNEGYKLYFFFKFMCFN